jgi:hypothetical protein
MNLMIILTEKYLRTNPATHQYSVPRAHPHGPLAQIWLSCGPDNFIHGSRSHLHIHRTRRFNPPNLFGRESPVYGSVTTPHSQTTFELPTDSPSSAIRPQRLCGRISRREARQLGSPPYSGIPSTPTKDGITHHSRRLPFDTPSNNVGDVKPEGKGL